MDPDHLASLKPADLDLLCFKIRYLLVWFIHVLFDQSLLHKYNIIEVGSDSKP